MTDIIEQIQTELKEERKYNLTIKYLPHVALVVVLFFISVSIYIWRDNVRTRENNEITSIIFDILNNKNADTANLKKELTKYSTGLGELALLLDFSSINKEHKFKTKLMKDIAMLKHGEAADDCIFLQTIREQKLVDGIGNVPREESLTLINNLLEKEYILPSVEARLKSLKTVMENVTN